MKNFVHSLHLTLELVVYISIFALYSRVIEITIGIYLFDSFFKYETFQLYVASPFMSYVLKCIIY